MQHLEVSSAVRYIYIYIYIYMYIYVVRQLRVKISLLTSCHRFLLVRLVQHRLASPKVHKYSGTCV